MHPEVLQSMTQTQTQASVSYDETISWPKLKTLVSTPSVLLILLQGVPGCVPWGFVYVFLIDYMAQNRDMSVSSATTMMTVFSIGSLLGQVLGGWMGQRLHDHNPQYQCVLMGLSTIMGTFPMMYIVNCDAKNKALLSVMFFITGAVSSMYVCIYTLYDISVWDDNVTILCHIG